MSHDLALELGFFEPKSRGCPLRRVDTRLVDLSNFSSFQKKIEANFAKTKKKKKKKKMQGEVQFWLTDSCAGLI